MPLNLTFGPVALAANSSQDFGPHTVAAGETNAALTVIRNIPGGLDDNPGTVITLKFSAPNGWSVTAKIPGGPETFVDRHGVTQTVTQNTINVGLNEVQGLSVTANVAVTSGPVQVQGSFVIT